MVRGSPATEAAVRRGDTIVALNLVGPGKGRNQNLADLLRLAIDPDRPRAGRSRRRGRIVDRPVTDLHQRQSTSDSRPATVDPWATVELLDQ